MPTQRPLRYHNLHAGGPVIDQDENLYQMTAKGLFALNSSGRLDSFGYRLAVGRWLPWFTGSRVWRDRGDPRSRAVALWNAWKVQQWGDPGRRLPPGFQQGMIWEADEHFSESWDHYEVKRSQIPILQNESCCINLIFNSTAKFRVFLFEINWLSKMELHSHVVHCYRVPLDIMTMAMQLLFGTSQWVGQLLTITPDREWERLNDDANGPWYDWF